MSEYGPMDVKKAATGSGRSGKEEVQAFVKLVLGLSAIPKPDHAADALAVALCHCQGRAVRSALVDTPRSGRL
jgi:crossover junction endodeoxyribonuclease RuvC